MFRVVLERVGSFRTDRRGVVAVEMALVSPFLIVLFCGITELSFLVSAHHRASQTSAAMADAVSRYDTITAADLIGIMSASGSILDTADAHTRVRSVISSVQREDGTDRSSVVWQCADEGSLRVQSSVGRTGEAATLPGDLDLAEKDNVIVAEVFYEYRPLFETAGVPRSILAKSSVFRPRMGSLSSDPNCRG